MKNEDLDAQGRITVTFGVDFCLLSFDQVLKIAAVLFDCNTHDKVRTWHFLCKSVERSLWCPLGYLGHSWDKKQDKVLQKRNLPTLQF